MGEVQVKIKEASGFLKASLDSCRLNFSELTPVEARREIDNMVSLVNGLKEVSDCSRYLQGGLIAQLNDDSRWKLHSKDSKDMSWPEFCEKVLGVKIRSAQYLMNVYYRAGELGLGPEIIEEIGWTKCKDLVRVATEETIEEWVEKARIATTRQLAEEIQKVNQRVEVKGEEALGERQEGSLFKVRMSPEQIHNVEAAIEDCHAVAKKESGTKLHNRGDMLDLIVTDWRANHIRSKARSLEWHLKQIRRAYKVDIEIEEAEKS